MPPTFPLGPMVPMGLRTVQPTVLAAWTQPAGAEATDHALLLQSRRREPGCVLLPKLPRAVPGLGPGEARGPYPTSQSFASRVKAVWLIPPLQTFSRAPALLSWAAA